MREEVCPLLGGGSGAVEVILEIGGAAQRKSEHKAMAVVNGPVPASHGRSAAGTLVTIRKRSMSFGDRAVEHGPASAEECVLTGYRMSPPGLDGDFAGARRTSDQT